MGDKERIHCRKLLLLQLQYEQASAFKSLLNQITYIMLAWKEAQKEENGSAVELTSNAPNANANRLSDLKSVPTNEGGSRTPS